MNSKEFLCRQRARDCETVFDLIPFRFHFSFVLMDILCVCFEPGVGTSVLLNAIVSTGLSDCSFKTKEWRAWKTNERVVIYTVTP